jgi:hypothetical protein
MTSRRRNGNTARSESPGQSRGRFNFEAEGFRRFKIYANALDPFDLRAILDPQESDDPNAAWHRLGTQRSKELREALKQLDEVAPKIFTKLAGARPCCDVTSFILAKDQEEHAPRARAIVARAYWRADEYSHALAQSFYDAQRSAKIVKAFDDFGVDFKAEYAMELLSRWRRETWSEKNDREEIIRNGLGGLDRVVGGLRYFAEEHSQHGRTPDSGRFFFALRLAEAFTIWRGRPPDFDSGKEDRKRSTEWLRFIEAALAVSGLSSGRLKGLEGLLRRLCDLGPIKKDDNPLDSEARKGELRHYLQSLLIHFYKKPSFFSEGYLPSSGFLIDVWRGDPSLARTFEPSAYKWFLPASQRRKRH